MPFVCHVLPHVQADGPANMAVDEALLESVAADPSAAVFRTYGWTVPTLSLGYFQHHAEAEADPRLRDAPIVRRPTGGGAIWHDREITYAIVLPRTHPAARSAADLYRAVHEAIAALLRTEGVEAHRRGGERDARAENQQSWPFFCFTDLDPEDIVLNGVKVVGSAQRRRSGAVLQHGSLLLSHAERTPELLGLGDLVSIETDPSYWSSRLCAAIPGVLSLNAQAQDLSAAERARADALRHQVYGNTAWTRRR
ncbi:MAG TPA: biotin/lipoate A/B protein ligase family protein [Isosphaeraceae bacterium]|jgi:lipoate-protein ligase A|nr:biotin/lipoate A/B protein ligase family protein [Isosphaeraceae bacterium]